MHGAAQTAKAAPRRAPEPRRCAPVKRLGATSRSGHGRRPRKASPSTTKTKPASSERRLRSRSPPRAAAPAPRATKTAVKPSTNGTLARATRRPTPASPSRSASTAETADRYPGTRGRTQGVMIEKSPARNATGSSVVIARELTVEPALELRIERRAPVRVRRSLDRARATPAPDEDRDYARSDQQPRQRQDPGEPMEPLTRWRRQHRRSEVRDELVLDLLLGGTVLDPPRHVGLDLPRHRRVRLVERGLAGGADQLVLETGR